MTSTSHDPAGSAGRRAAVGRRIAWEVLGALVAGSFALVALAHALGGAKRGLVLTDGDSVLLPMMVRSFERGEALQWGMSPVLFVFPELPLYLLSAAVTTGVAAALLLNGVLNVVILHALLRAVSGRIAAALAGVGALMGLTLLEARPGGNTAELASLTLTTTYYSGTLMALVAAVALAVALANGRQRRIRITGTALGLLSAAATLSNPLYVLWVTIPLGLALGLVVLLRWRASPASARLGPAVAAAALVAGSAVGYVARTPLSRFLIADQKDYLRWDQSEAALSFTGDALRTLVQTPGGVVEAAVMLLLVAFALVVAVAVIVRRATGAVLLVGLFGGVTMIVVPVVFVVTGSISSRYALPMLVTPLVVLAVVLARARVRRRAVIAVVVGVALVAGGVPATVVVSEAAGAGADPGAVCLSEWAESSGASDEGYIGVGQFWTSRALDVYADDTRVLQVNYDFSVYPWLVDLAAYRGARVGYVVVAHGGNAGGHPEYWGAELTDLGTPRDIVDCGTFDVYDFRGTSSAASLTATVTESARVQAALRGFGQ